MADKKTLIAAMEAAGYWFNEMEADEGYLPFFGEGARMFMYTWDEVEEWLEGIVFDDPAVSDAVESILHPERF